MVNAVLRPLRTIAPRAMVVASIVLPLSAIFLLASCVGCVGPALGDEPKEDITPTATAIGTYLEENLLLPAFGGRVFAACEILGAGPREIYVWVYAQEFYKQQDVLEKGTGLSCPVVLTVDSQDDREPWVIGHRLPRDGSLYSQDIKAMFPGSVQHLVNGIQQGQTIPELSNLVEEKARQWFDADVSQ